MRKLKSNKAPEPANIPGDVPKLIEEQNLYVVSQILNEIYDTGEILRDWLLSTFIPILKKPTTKNCQD